jgi:glucose/mannose-6-phosphate isomerase
VAVKALAFFLLLRPEPLHPSIALRYKLTEELLEIQGLDSCSLEGRGDTPLAQMLSTIILGDYTSYYLALLQGIDPSPVQAMDFIKDRLLK